MLPRQSLTLSGGCKNRRNKRQPAPVCIGNSHLTLYIDISNVLLIPIEKVAGSCSQALRYIEHMRCGRLWNGALWFVNEPDLEWISMMDETFPCNCAPPPL